jgi:hypothetical protein
VSPFLAGFASEFKKLGGVITGIGKTIAKHPIQSLVVGGAALGTASQATRAYREGISGGQKARYLAAGVEGPSQAAYTNYHDAFPHEMKPWEKRRLSWNFNDDKLRS